MRPPAFNLLLRPPHDPTPDDVLLTEFATRRDPVVFERLVHRHAGTVWDVCLRVTGSAHDADDAFQATFLVLLRSARSALRVRSLGGWLYGVAFRVASKARVAAARRARRERTAARPEHTTDSPEPSADFTAAVHAELAALPDRYRLAVLLCDLEGLSRTDAATRLGWKEGTLSGRLNRGRKRLAERLSARGITAAAVLATATITLPSSAVEPVLAWARTEIPRPTPAVAALATGVKRDMTLKLFARVIVLSVAVLSLLGIGVVGLFPAPQSTAAPVPKVETVDKEEMTPDRLTLLDNRRVQRELKMTPEQRAKLLDGLDALLDDRGAEVDAADGRIPPAYRDYQHFEQVYQGKRRELAASVITPKQFSRLTQIEVQVTDELAPMIPWVAEKMQLTEKQKERVVDVLRTNEDFRGVGGQAFDPSRVPFVYKTQAQMRELVEQELTKEQRKVWVELAGEKTSFDFAKTWHDFNLRSKYRGLLRRDGDEPSGGKGGK